MTQAQLLIYNSAAQPHQAVVQAIVQILAVIR